MKQDQTAYEHSKIANGEKHISAGSLLFFILFYVIAVGVITVLAELENIYWLIGFCVAVLIFPFVLNTIVLSSDSRQFFDNPDNHTHDDECATCGVMYGLPTGDTQTPKYIKRIAYECRHASGKMKYPR